MVHITGIVHPRGELGFFSGLEPEIAVVREIHEHRAVIDKAVADLGSEEGHVGTSAQGHFRPRARAPTGSGQLNAKRPEAEFLDGSVNVAQGRLGDGAERDAAARLLRFPHVSISSVACVAASGRLGLEGPGLESIRLEFGECLPAAPPGT